MDERILKFLRRQHVMTLATSSPTGPWVCQAFYVPSRDEVPALIFTSSSDTRHIAEALADPRVAVSVALQTRVVGRLQGIQITGVIGPATDSDKMTYVKRFPFAAPMLQELWRVEIHTAKYTDNTLGFGKKITYKLT